LGPQIPSLIAAGTLSANVPPDFGYVTDAAQKEAQEKLAGRLGKFPAHGFWNIGFVIAGSSG
jgi:hypothetical protein